MGSNSDLFSTNTVEEERVTCESKTILVSSTKVPNFPITRKRFKVLSR